MILKKVNLNSYITFCIVSLAIVTGCKNNPSNTESAAPNPTSSTSPLNQNGLRGNAKQYRIRIFSTPDIIEIGKPVVFSLTPQIVGKEIEPVPLDNEHGYEIHLIIVSYDLSWFDHRHPGLSDLGSYEQPYTFDKGGNYLLYADYKPIGSVDTVQIKTIAVTGFSEKAISYSEPKLASSTDGYEVKISPDTSGHFESGKMQTLTATISKGNVPVDPNSLGDYLGSKGHMVIIAVVDKKFIHTHPTVENGQLVFHTFFYTPGMYRAWLQFQNENIVHTADFTIRVDQGNASGMEGDHMSSGQH